MKVMMMAMFYDGGYDYDGEVMDMTTLNRMLVVKATMATIATILSSSNRIFFHDYGF